MYLEIGGHKRVVNDHDNASVLVSNLRSSSNVDNFHQRVRWGFQPQHLLQDKKSLVKQALNAALSLMLYTNNVFVTLVSGLMACFNCDRSVMSTNDVCIPKFTATLLKYLLVPVK